DRHRRTAAGNALHAVDALAGGLEVLHEAEPDRWDTEGAGYAFPLEELLQARAIEPGAGKDEVRAGHRRGVRDAPGIDVEHRHDGTQHIVHRDPDIVRCAKRKGMEERRAMAVEGALGIAGRARGVAERGRGVLVELRPL